ncbi:hypothetical protein PL321_00605 [Caloramator sp. mosi_1]|nr:hypothetical protein [Caloramator sp. mosi_1]WDC85524.1 hypothetical protein PL321_00605 [Caloramator sp. mosi_1]
MSTKDAEEEFHSVIIDNERAAYEAVRYLIKLEHKKIAMIAGEKNDPNAGIPRLEGYKKALKENGIDIDDNLIFMETINLKAVMML